MKIDIFLQYCQKECELKIANNNFVNENYDYLVKGLRCMLSS